MINTVGVIGLGTMGAGIVEVFAKAGIDVTYVTRSQAKVDGVRAGRVEVVDQPDLAAVRADEDRRVTRPGDRTPRLGELDALDAVMRVQQQPLWLPSLGGAR
mgnify:CR=1 FL=1